MSTDLRPSASLFDVGQGPSCHKCQRLLGATEAIQAAGLTWHPSGCFTCSFCNEDITADFVERHRRVFCLSCDKKLFGSYCGEKAGDHTAPGAGCGQIIQDQFVEAHGHLFHPLCLTCSRCKRQPRAAGDLFLLQGQFLCGSCSKVVSEGKR